MALRALANPYVLAIPFLNCFSRRSIIGGTATKEKKLSLSKNGSWVAENFWDITSKFGQTDIHSNQKSKDRLYHLKDQNGSSSHQTTASMNASELTKLSYKLSNEDFKKEILKLNHTTDQRTSHDDMWLTDYIDWFE
jgi:hypothetical protein